MSELNQLIPAEIKNDEFYYLLEYITRTVKLSSLLEIGASSGEGSTEALVRGINQNPSKPILYTMEVSAQRFAKLRERYKNQNNVKSYNYSSISIQDFPEEHVVTEFYNTTSSSLHAYPLERVLGWLKQDIAYISENGIQENGIHKIKEGNGIADFDFVLLDGSEFSGERELEILGRPKIIALDDINTFKMGALFSSSDNPIDA